MNNLTNLTDGAAWADDDDDAIDYNEDVDFSNYVPTAYQPGWDWTYYIIFICLGLNVLLPFALWLANRRKKVAAKSETVALVSSYLGGKKKTNNMAEDDDMSIGGMSVASSAMSVVSSVLDQRVHKGNFHRQQARKPRGRRFVGPKEAYSNPNGTDNKGGDAHSFAGSYDEISVDANGQVAVKDAAASNSVERELSFGERLVDCSTWDKEMRKIVSLWVPYSVSGATEGFAQIVNFGIISHFVGLREANAYVAVVILTEFTDVFTFGFVKCECRHGIRIGKSFLFVLTLFVSLFIYFVTS